jgi:hypothetical protein
LKHFSKQKRLQKHFDHLLNKHLVY